MYNNSSDNSIHTEPSNNKVLETLALELLKEQRRKRRWGIFFKLIFLIIVLILIWGSLPLDSISDKLTHRKSIAQINLFGEIGTGYDVDAQDTISALDDAADNDHTQAIILDIDSPGGSPVQASYIYNEIRHIKKEHADLPIYAVCEDVCASAAYYVASATDKIYANPTSLVGSIGVLMDGFGFVDGMKKVGISRRLYTAGQYKGFLDPYSPAKPEEVKILQEMLDADHQVFINDVKAGRGNRLKDDPLLFSGLAWNGPKAKELGLIDGFGSLLDVSREVFDNDNIIDYTVHSNLFDRLASQFGTKFVHQVKMQLLTYHLA